ncbi:GntR family transcriptional regulator [Oleispirillum naphthae]|uniref:GntR family transcriptional regulator n=1 Tax=Oleispirillum naphthae TaxID=2838853 RepID=UPI00308238D3
MTAASALIARSSVEDIRQALADDILLGRIAPGTHLSEASLSLRFGVSRTPVREALNQIVASGLLERRANAGVRVCAVPERRLAEMFELSAELEAICARHAAKRITETERDRLLAIHRRGRDCLAADNPEAYDAANLDFHATIFNASHNAYLVEAALSARARVIPYRRAQFASSERMHRSFAEHEAIVAALTAGDAAAAEAAMRTHVGAAGAASRRMLETTPLLNGTAPETTR